MLLEITNISKYELNFNVFCLFLKKKKNLFDKKILTILHFEGVNKIKKIIL